MSKRENHWYLVGTILDRIGKARRPRAWSIAVSIVLTVALLAAVWSGALDPFLRGADAPGFLPIVVGLFAVAALTGGVLFGLVKRSAMRTAYLGALQSPRAEPLIAVLERSARLTRTLPDGDALVAQSKALAYALYGRGADAASALAEVDWSAKAPMIRAIGLSAEAVTEALCRRNAQRALELARQARAMSSVSAKLPGAAQTARYHATCVGLAEALLDVELNSTHRALEEAAADPRFPPLQLIASFALAIGAERSGDSDRSGQLHAFLLQTAPHCAPLHASAGTASGPAAGDTATWPAAGPVSSAAGPAPGRPQEEAGRRKLLTRAGIKVGLWALLLLAYAASRWFYSAHR
ncbi:MAG: hypothetical protein WCC48_13410 [Anaeromyxobacteraceae bacterium]